MAPSNIIHCRARVSVECYDGQPSAKYYHDGETWLDDGTYQQGTIVCNACYVMCIVVCPSGSATHAELPECIRTLQAMEETAP